MNVKSIETNFPSNSVKINFPEEVKGQLDAVVNGSRDVEQLSGERAKEIASQIPLVTPVEGIALAGPLEVDTLEIGDRVIEISKKTKDTPIEDVAEQAAKKMSKGKAAAVVVGTLALIGAAFGIKKAVDNKNANKAANQA